MRKLPILLIPLLFILIGSIGFSSNGYSYTKQINITYFGTESLENVNEMILWNTASEIPSGKLQPDCSDMNMRCFNHSTIMDVPFYLESGCNTSATKIWFKVPYLQGNNTGNTFCYIDYGNASQFSKSDGNATFLFFDDFDDGVIDSTKWDNSTNVDFLETGGSLIHNPNVPPYTGGGGVISSQAISPSVAGLGYSIIARYYFPYIFQRSIDFYGFAKFAPSPNGSYPFYEQGISSVYQAGYYSKLIHYNIYGTPTTLSSGWAGYAVEYQSKLVETDRGTEDWFATKLDDVLIMNDTYHGVDDLNRNNYLILSADEVQYVFVASYGKSPIGYTFGSDTGETGNEENSTATAPVVQSVVVPSYPTTNENFKCWADITGTGGSITANWIIYRKQTGEPVFTNVAYGHTVGVASGVMTNVGNASGYTMTNNSQYYCYVTGTINSITGNSTNSSIVTAMKRATFTVLPPSSSVSGENSVTRLNALLTQNPSVYAYAECDYRSPTSAHYYPPNATGNTNFCYLLDFNSPRYIYVSMQTNQTGTWYLDSCYLYLSNYSDCRQTDLSSHYSITGIGSWAVTSAPIVQTVSVTPTSPNPNDDLYCYAKLTSDQNATFQAEVRWSLNGAYLPIQMVAVSNNTNTLVSTLSHTIMQLGDNVSCVVRGYDGVNYGSYYSSNVVNVLAYYITNLNTTPEPTLLGMGKTVSFHTEIPTFSTKIYYTKPSGATGVYNIIESARTNHIPILLTGISTADFNEVGVYHYTIKSCNCLMQNMDDINLCPMEQCVVATDYPSKTKAMTFSTASNYYLYDEVIFNTTIGSNLQVSTLFSKATNIYKVVIHYPDSSQHIFRSILQDRSDGTMWLSTGTGKNITATGNFTADIYGAYGAYTDTSDCLDTTECQYSNYTLGIPFEITTSASGSIENVTPSSVYYGNDVNLEFDTTAPTDATCIRFTYGEGNYGMTKYKNLINSSLPTHWVIPTTSGEGNFFDFRTNWNMDIRSCKNNGTRTCMNTLCDVSNYANCDYCLNSDTNTISVLDTAISNVHYNTPIGKSCEDLVINFTVNPATTKVALFFDTGIVGLSPMYVNSTSSVAKTNWTINVPYSTLLNVICNSQSPTLCNYNNKVFWIQSFDLNGNLSLQGSGNLWSVDQSKTCTFENRGGSSSSGTGIGQIIGDSMGLSGAIGDMILALIFSLLLTIGTAMVMAMVGANNAVVPVAVFIVCLCVFSVAGMLPIWIPLILIILVGYIIVSGVVKMFSGG